MSFLSFFGLSLRRQMQPTPTDHTEPQNDARELIIQTALRRFRRHGFKSVTMDDLARELGMSKKTIYEVVGNKQTLIDLVLDVDMEADDQAIHRARENASDAVEEMLNITHYFTDSMREINPASLYDLQKYYRRSWEKIDLHHNQKMIEHVRANLLRGQHEGLYRTDLDVELISQLFVVMPQTILNPERIQVSQEAWSGALNQLMLYHLLGVCSPAGRELLSVYLERSPNA